jgi:hypothetical protein
MNPAPWWVPWLTLCLLVYILAREISRRRRD